MLFIVFGQIVDSRGDAWSWEGEDNGKIMGLEWNVL